MTPEQIKIAVARELGWRKVNVFRWSGGITRLPKQWVDVEDLPDYPNDRNTQPEMLAAMTEAEQWNLITLHFSNCGAPNDKRFELKLLKLSQIDFARLFLKVKGKWVE